MTSPEAAALHRSIYNRILVTAIPSAVVAAYVFGLIIGLDDAALIRALVGLLGPILALAALQQYLISRGLTRAAVAEHPGEPAGARLVRLLVLPRKIELLSNVSTWVVGGTIYGLLAVIFYGKPLAIVPMATVVALFASLFPGMILVLLIEEDVRPVALAEASRAPGLSPKGGGIFWPRQRWVLPYAFVVAVLSLLVFSGMVLVSKYDQSVTTLLDGLRAAGQAIKADALRADLDHAARVAVLPVLGIALVILGAFWTTGLLLARRQAAAAAEVEASLRAMAAGAPRLPRWVATDEIGDLAFATAGISEEMRRIFEQLQAMAKGDLTRDLDGESGLIQAFRDSRTGMLELSRRMAALSRGEAIEGAAIAGDLGDAFGQLQRAFEAIVGQARTIAEGDLRRDVEVPGALGVAMQRMTGNLRTVVGRTQGVSGDVGNIVVSLQSAAAQLSAATTEQVAAVTETANTMTEMAQTSAVSADRAGELIRQGEASAAVVEEGGAAAETATHAMAAISGSLERVAQASAALAERVQRIDGITETVSFLADQSSTLAINAAIEAARAGDAGKGFAVVAREIRALAADSRKAAAEIREILAEIRDRTGQVDGAVGAGTRTVEDGGKLVQRLGEVVGQLGVTVHDSVGLMRQVEGSARQHQAGVGQVSQALTNMQKASESIRDGARLLGELSSKAHELAASLQKAAGAYTLPGAQT
ncbi:methyl-accepting chemotaxis protein [Anaeromyxobacter oryzisoli]|uniref:methyl-accepting chemotaxis protein n=1 Tax=Anaeromyxobacter oryzisoli TaxID=2925408 RepID=UPI001F59F120|nr:methyl-accepting chemotaxis protein [Anaeromyxobacter sp. SG63]